MILLNLTGKILVRKMKGLTDTLTSYIVVSFFTFSLLASPTVSWDSSYEISLKSILNVSTSTKVTANQQICNWQDTSARPCHVNNSPDEDEDTVPDEASFQFDTIDDLIEAHFDLSMPTQAMASFAKHPMFLATASTNLLRPPWKI